MANDFEKMLKQAESDAKKAASQAEKAAKGGAGGSDFDKMLRQAQADAASASQGASLGGQVGSHIPSPIRTGAKGLLGGLMRTIQVPQQAAFRAGSGLGELVTGHPGAAAKELQAAASTPLQVVGKGPKELSFAEATTPVAAREQGLVRKLPTGLNTAANLLLDPTLPSAFAKGTKGAKEAVKVAEDILGAEAAARIAKEGVSALSKGERATLEAGIASRAAEVGATGGRRTLSEIAQGVKAPEKLGAQAGAERVVKKTVGALESAEKAKPVTPIGKFASIAPGKAAEAAHIPQAVEAIKTSDFGKWVGDALIPRAGIIRDYGKKVAEQVKAAGGERLARVSRRAGDALAETQAQITKVGRELGAEDNKLLAAALRGEKWAQDAIGSTDLGGLYNHLSSLEEGTKGAFGVLETAQKGKKAEQRISEAVTAPKVGGESPARARLREILARQGTTPEAVAGAEKAGTAKLPAGAVVEAPKPKVPKKLDELAKHEISDATPIQDVLNRNFQAIHQQETKRYLLNLKNTLKDAEGNPLIKDIGKGGATEDGYVKLRSGYWGKGQAPEAIAREIDRVGRLLSDEKAIAQFDKLVNRADRMWKSSLTSLPVSAGFTLRNMRSNLFLNWLDGIQTMKPYQEALAIQRKAGTVLKGEKYADEIAANGIRATMKAHLTPREFKIWELADSKRVLGTNYFDIDLAFAGIAPQAGKLKGVATEEAGRFARTRKAITATNDFGKRVNGAVEDNAKLANFIHNLDRYGDAETAAQHVHKFLFDYGDLTKFEQDKVRKIIPFYTFMRKNVPLQIEQAFLQPGKIGARLKIGSEVTKPLPEGAPSYLQQQSARVLPGALGKVLGTSAQVALSPDNPIAAAAQTLEPVAALIAAIPSIAQGKAPDNLKADVFSPLYSIMGGSRGVIPKLIAGEAAGKDMFTGADLPPKDLRDRIIKAILPFAQRAQSVRFNTESERIPYIGALIQRQTKQGETIPQFLLRQAGIRTRQVQ